MNFQPSHKPSFLKRITTRLGLDSKQKQYFFYMPNMKSAKGSFIALAAVFMVIVAVLIPVSMTLVANIRRNTLQAQEYVAGAQNAAKAGLEDTLGYFVRQNKLLTAYPSQIMEATPTAWAVQSYNASPTPSPVYFSYVDQPFNPIYNTSNAAYSDTFQGTTVNLAGGITHAFYGLCNEYPLDASTNTLAPAASSTQVSSVYFARYEVREQTNPVVTPAPTLDPMAVHDISGTRESNYMNGDGLTWAINSTGYIYERKDYTVDGFGEYLVPYNVYPNKVLATAKAYTEFRKLSCTLPNSSSITYAGVYASAATDVILSGSCRLGNAVANGYGLCVMGGSASATSPTGAATTNFFGGGQVIYPGASGSAGSTANAPISDVNVFGMSLKDIQFIADYVGSSSITMNIEEPYKLSFYNGNLTYGPTQAATAYQLLDTSGILCVNGNLTLQSGGENSAGTADIQSSYYNGIIFATGNVTIQSGCFVDGAIILGYSALNPSQPAPQLSLTGAGTGNYSQAITDPEMVQHVIQLVAQYKEDISARKVLLAFPGI